MISNKDLQYLKDQVSLKTSALPELEELITELLAYREAERKRNSWDDAPEWCNWRATNEDGVVKYFETKPVIHEILEEWVTPEKDTGEYIVNCPTWRESLEERPK